MDRFALFVDAGYLLAAGGWATLGELGYRRESLDVDLAGLVTMLTQRAAASCIGRELLRVYWYDAAPDRLPTSEQLVIARLPDTKLRVGQLTSRGVQKGVDALLLSDLVELSRVRAIETAVLVAGDGDFVEAVAQAQRHGVRVLLWGVTGTPQNTVSPELRQEADRFDPLSAEELANLFSKRTPSTVTMPTAHDGGSLLSLQGEPAPVRPRFQPDAIPVYATIDPSEARNIGRSFASRWGLRATASEKASVIAGAPFLPGEIDAALIRFTLDEQRLPFGTRLAQEALLALRAGYLEALADSGPELTH